MTFRTSFALLLLAPFTATFGQDTLSIPEAVVQTTFTETQAASPRNLVTLDPEVITSAAQPSLDGLLETVPGIDARQRGPWGAQTDLSIRGGTFEQVALWVGGIRWSAPHTAHHLLNLPIDPEDIQQVQVVRGGSGALGSGGVTGGIVLHTGPGDTNGTEVSVEGGSYGWNRIRARHDWGQDQTRHRISLSRAATDGYQDNTDLAMTRLRYAGRKVTENGTFNLQAGGMSSAFGAQDFYTASFPQQFEQVGLWQGQLTWQHEVRGWNVEAGVHHRNHSDRFELFREGEGYYVESADGILTSDNGPVPGWYQGANQHVSAVSGARGGARRVTDWGETLISADFRREGVVSNRLGLAEYGRGDSSIYALGDRRTNLDVGVGQRIHLGRVTARALAAWNMNSAADGPRFIPEASLTLRIDDTGRAVAFASARRSVRMPSYTDLYYTVGGAQGSQDLLPEEAEHLEFGYRLTGELGDGHRLVLSQHLFHRWGRNLIDWVRFNGSSITQATNLRSVNFTGQEFALSVKATETAPALRYLTVSLTFMEADETSTGFESNYVLDILNSKADVVLGFRPLNDWMVDVRWSAQDRNGGYFDPVQGMELDFDPVQLVGATVRWTPESLPIAAHVRVDNALDAQYVDIGNVNQPGRWIRAGLTWTSGKK